MKALKKEEKTLKPKSEGAKTKATKSKSRPSEDDIRNKAHEIYNMRLEHGYYGSPESDWQEAEEYFMISID